jgi:hypothetical protein
MPEGLSEQEFISWLDELQTEWVHAARRLSPHLVTDLLEWTDSQVVDIVNAEDPSAPSARVSWASTHLVPVWLDHARELSERWIHRQQLLDAVGRPSDLRQDLADPVLDGLRWACPFRLDSHQRPGGANVEIRVAGPEVTCRWNLASDGTTWHFRDRRSPRRADATDHRAGVAAPQQQLRRDPARRGTRDRRCRDHRDAHPHSSNHRNTQLAQATWSLSVS